MIIKALARWPKKEDSHYGDPKLKKKKKKNTFLVDASCIVKIPNLYIILLCTHLYHFFQRSLYPVKTIINNPDLDTFFPYKRDFVTLNKSVINYLPNCTHHLL